MPNLFQTIAYPSKVLSKNFISLPYSIHLNLIINTASPNQLLKKDVDFHVLFEISKTDSNVVVNTRI